MADFVIRRWELAHYDGLQAPPHVHERGDEAFCVVRGRLRVLIGDTWVELGPGDHATVPAGTAHTFATAGPSGADVLAVMTPEIDALVTALHTATTDAERAAQWAAHHAHLAEDRPSTREPGE
ncbi:cupin domain-containing protein [Actinoplanes sp. NPDC051411]|uniref:cupin domain-containing protein n=1 Tax=Actinoplanes sp. NPDC051411 TaxID=3155522 RepID=UPI003433FE4F